MGFDLVTGNAALGEPVVPAGRREDYPRLVLVDSASPSSRRDWLGAIGSTLLDMSWLVWITFDALIVTIGVYLSHNTYAWIPDAGWYQVPWGKACLTYCGALVLSGLVFGLYEQQTLLRRSRTIARSILSVVGAMTLTGIVLNMLMYELISRRALFLSSMFYLTVALNLRLLACWCVNSHSRKFIIIGTDRKSRLSIASPDAPHSDGLSRRYRLVGHVSMDAIEVGREIDGARVLGTINEIEQICLEHGVDDVVVGPGAAKNPRVLDRMLGCLKLGCRVTHLSTFYEQVMSEVPVALLEPNWFLFADLKHYREAQLIMKRACDVVGALVGLVLTLPFWPFVGLLIKLTSPGPVFYSQRRVGQNGRTFRLYKFRTMYRDAERDGHAWAAERDPRVTRVGWYLRKARIDELPQLWNILLGHMSIVGPRPERPEFVEQLASKIRFYNERHLIKPGLSGWAQINYRYGASVEDARRKLQLDLWYMKNMSIELDMVILLRTMGTLFLGSR